MKGARAAKRSSIGNIVRRRLSDITNSIPQPKSPANTRNDPSSEKEYIDHLVKENMALVKLIQDKNKIIEFSGVELQKLRVSLQKMQLQNWNLAQSNSQMLAELNMNKEKLKFLQHEIVCKEAVFKAKNLEVKEQESTNGEMNTKQDGEVALQNTEDSKPSRSNRGLRATRSLSMSHSTSSQQVAKEEAADKRRRLRRQSASCRMQQQEAVEDLYELENIETQILDGPTTPFPYSGNGDGSSGAEAQQSNRTSIGRPSRKAAEKVQSYKEVPLNVKMRRSD